MYSFFNSNRILWYPQPLLFVLMPVFFFLCVQKHLEGEAEKSIIINEITLTKSENAMIMLNYIEKIALLSEKFQRQSFAVPISHNRSS